MYKIKRRTALFLWFSICFFVSGSKSNPSFLRLVLVTYVVQLPSKNRRFVYFVLYIESIHSWNNKCVTLCEKKDEYMAMVSRVCLRKEEMLVELQADLLPCTIDYEGSAPVTGYFRPTPTDDTSDGSMVMEASFRGRHLRGAELELPSGYVSVLLQQTEVSSGLESSSEGCMERKWEALGRCHPIRYWNHDVVPRRTDDPRRCMEWLHVAQSISKHVPLEQLEIKRSKMN